MKKSLIFILLAILLSAGCSSSRNENTRYKEDLPEWYINPPESDVLIYGLGSAKLSNDSMSQNTAVSRARTNIVIQISRRLESVMNDYIKDSKIKDNQSESYIKTIRIKVIDVELTDTVLEKIYVTQDNHWYALVSYPREKTINIVSKIIEDNKTETMGDAESKEIIRNLITSIKKDPLQSSASQ